MRFISTSTHPTLSSLTLVAGLALGVSCGGEEDNTDLETGGATVFQDAAPSPGTGSDAGGTAGTGGARPGASDAGSFGGQSADASWPRADSGSPGSSPAHDGGPGKADAGEGGTSAPDAASPDSGTALGDGGVQDAGVGEPPGRACHSQEDWTPQPNDLWIAPNGSDSSPGTEASPKKSLTAALSAWSAGKTIWVSPGTYAASAAIPLSTKASSSGPLRISGITGGAKPVFDFSGEPRSSGNGGQRGFQISGSYVHLRYLEIKKAADNCVYVTGANNTLEWLSVHECQDTGVQLSNGAASNKVLNVDSYLNADPSGENADGFAPKLSIGQNNYFCGTRSYENADDGYDCWSSGDNSPVKFEYCWSFGHPGPTSTENGDGNGFKLGSPSTLASGGNAPHELIDCYAFHNKATGFTANGNRSGKIKCTNCGVWANGTAWSGGSGGTAPQHTGDITNLNVSVEKAENAARDANGDLPDIARL